MATLYTDQRIGMWGQIYEMGVSWLQATSARQIIAVNTVEGIWKTFLWRSGDNPFASEQIANELEYAAAAHARHIYEADGLPTVLLPPIVEELIGRRIEPGIQPLVRAAAGAAAEGYLTQAEAADQYVRINSLAEVMARNFRSAGDMAFGTTLWRLGAVPLSLASENTTFTNYREATARRVKEVWPIPVRLAAENDQNADGTKWIVNDDLLIVNWRDTGGVNGDGGTVCIWCRGWEGEPDSPLYDVRAGVGNLRPDGYMINYPEHSPAEALDVRTAVYGLGLDNDRGWLVICHQPSSDAKSPWIGVALDSHRDLSFRITRIRFNPR